MNQIQAGKVRNFYTLDEERLIQVTNDSISISKKLLPNVFDGKGKMQSQIAEFWFKETRNICENHFITSDTEELPTKFQTDEYAGRTMILKKLKMIPVRVIARKRLTGDALDSYNHNGTVCGFPLQTRRRYQEAELLPYLFITFHLREKGKPDRVINEYELNNIVQRIAGNRVSSINDGKPSHVIAQKVRELFTFCSKEALKKEIVVADAKFEFGIDKSGKIILADDFMTPDSCRLWPADKIIIGETPESWDKQYIKKYLLENGWNPKEPLPVLKQDIVDEICARYRQVYETFLQKEFF